MCFWRQFADTHLQYVLSKFAKWWIVGAEMHKRMSVHTPAPETQNQNYQPSDPLHPKTVWRRKQTVHIGMSGSMWCQNTYAYVCVCVWRDSVCVCLCVDLL